MRHNVSEEPIHFADRSYQNVSGLHYGGHRLAPGARSEIGSGLEKLFRLAGRKPKSDHTLAAR